MFGKGAAVKIPQRELIFILCILAITCDMAVYTLVVPVLPSYAMSLGADTVTIGIIFGSFSVALLIFSIPFGILSDRLGRKWFMILGMLSLAATNVVFAMSGNVYILIVARLLQGMSGAATWSAGLALLADTFGPEERGQRLGFAMSAMSVGTLFGPVAGGILYDSLGYAPTFIIPSALACVVGILFFTIGEPASRAAHVSFRDRLAPFLVKPRTFLILAIVVAIGAATYGILEPYMPVYLYSRFNATPTLIGLAFGAMSLFSMIAQPIVGKLYDLRGGRSLIAAGLACSALVIAVSVIMPSLLLASVVFALLGITMGFALTPMLPLLSDMYGGDGNSTGLVYGIYNTLFSVGLALGPLAGALFIASFSFRITIFGQAVLLVLAAIGAYLVIGQKGQKSSKT